MKYRNGGLVSVDIHQTRFDDPIELIAHELEHVIEQLDGIDLDAQARTGTVWKREDGAFETRRGPEIGKRVAANSVPDVKLSDDPIRVAFRLSSRGGNMTSALLLRIVSVVALLQFVGHGTMFVLARPTHGPDEVAVVDAMRSRAFTFALAPRTYWDMYFGYGLEAAFVCLVEAALFWLLAGATSGNAALVRSVAALFAVANVAHIVMLVRYFAFPLPMVFDALIAAGLVAAAVVAR
jgi:hypothetical protein